MRSRAWMATKLGAGALGLSMLACTVAYAGSYEFDLDAANARTSHFKIGQIPDSGHVGGRIKFVELRGDKESDAKFTVTFRNALGSSVSLWLLPLDKGKKLKVRILTKTTQPTDPFEATYPGAIDLEQPVSIDWDEHAVLTIGLPDGSSRHVSMAGAYTMELGAASAEVECTDWSITPVSASVEGKTL
jgi:hypothetical protein